MEPLFYLQSTTDYELDMTNGYHIIPCNDIREHVSDSECWCKPELGDDGLEHMYIHKSAAGWEDFAEGTRKPS